MLMLMLGQFVPYTYIAPLLQEVTGLDASTVPWVLLLSGIGATIGVFIGGKLSAGRMLMPSLITMLALQAAGATAPAGAGTALEGLTQVPGRDPERGQRREACRFSWHGSCGAGRSALARPAYTDGGSRSPAT